MPRQGATPLAGGGASRGADKKPIVVVTASLALPQARSRWVPPATAGGALGPPRGALDEMNVVAGGASGELVTTRTIQTSQTHSRA
jgi:hypothetical protein